jgi:hypothetical protein
MPYPNFHSARVKEPGDFLENDTHHIVMLAELPNGIQIYGGRLKSDPEGGTKPQTYRFPKTKFSPESARAWLKQHDISPISFEVATEKKDGEGIQKNVLRFDRSPIGQATMTPEGYLKADAIVTRSGIFEYKNVDGTIRKELRSPEEVFKTDSMESMKMIPVTDLHPRGMFVDASNSKDLAIGHTGENIRQSEDFIIAPLVINRKDGVESVKKGRKELSLGYNADLILEPGIWNGQKYDGRQENIRYNHLAIVDSARAGKEACLHIDESDINVSNNLKPKGAKMPQLNLDGIQYEAAQEVINRLQKVESENASLKVKLDTAETANTKNTAAIDEQKTKIEKMEKIDHSAEITAAVTSRIALEKKAAKVLDEKEIEALSGKPEIEIKKSVIVKLHKDVKLDDKNPDYINARFDAAMENEKNFDADAIARQKAQVKDGGEKDTPPDAEKSRLNMIKRMKDGCAETVEKK